MCEIGKNKLKYKNSLHYSEKSKVNALDEFVEKIRQFQMLIIFFLASIFTLYIVLSIPILRYITGDGYWTYTPPGSLFPIPQRPGFLAALSEMTVLDKIIYSVFLKTYILHIITLGLWIAGFAKLYLRKKLIDR